MSNTRSFQTCIRNVSQLSPYERLKLRFNVEKREQHRKEVYDYIRETVNSFELMDPENFLGVLHAIQLRK